MTKLKEMYLILGLVKTASAQTDVLNMITNIVSRNVSSDKGDKKSQLKVRSNFAHLELCPGCLLDLAATCHIPNYLDPLSAHTIDPIVHIHCATDMIRNNGETFSDAIPT